MAKKQKPSLALVGTEAVGVQPPFTLGKHGRSLWDRVQSEYDVGDAAGIELLAQACAAADLAERLQTEIEADGPVVRIRGSVRSHPRIRDLIAARSFVTRTLVRLGLNYEPVRTSPVRGGSATWTG